MAERSGSSIVALLLLSLAAPCASATAQRTFVASTGNDSNPCSLAQPCRSFATAISRTNAGGEVVVLDSAGYGPVTITKSVSIVAPAGIHAGISVSSGDGVTINAPGAIVVLRGLSISGQGGAIGINIQQAFGTRIESSSIAGMMSNGILQTSGGQLAVNDTIVRDNGGSGIGIAADATVIMDHVRSVNNTSDGFYIQPVALGAHASITDSVLAWNGSNGAWANSAGPGASTTALAIDRSVVSNNGIDGIRANSSPGGVELNVTRNVIQHNGLEGIEIIGQSAASFAVGTINENAFSRNGDYAIRCVGSDTAFAKASRNTIPLVDENGAFQQGGSCFFYSFSDNSGAASISGTVIPVTGF